MHIGAVRVKRWILVRQLAQGRPVRMGHPGKKKNSPKSMLSLAISPMLGYECRQVVRCSPERVHADVDADDQLLVVCHKQTVWACGPQSLLGWTISLSVHTFVASLLQDSLREVSYVSWDAIWGIS